MVNMLSMRLRLILSFILIVLVSISTVVLVARSGNALAVHAYMVGSGMVDLASLENDLEDYYQSHGTWQGVASVFGDSGPGMMGGGMGRMMGQRIRLADSQGNIIYDRASATPSGRLSSADIQSADSLSVNGKIVGYLLAAGGMGQGSGPGSQAYLLNRLNSAALTAALVAGGLSLLLALLLAYGLLRPISQLTKASQSLASGNLSERVPVHGTDELAGLGRAFNQMAASLQKSEETRQAMTADIAHELRTPLAVQRAQLEALQDGVYALTPENIAPILEQNKMLTRLVEDLRTLALADAGQLPLEKVPTDLSGLVRRVVERFIPQADERKVLLVYHPPDNEITMPLVLLDPIRIEQILVNLLANALRYTPEGGQVTVSLTRENNTTRLSVRDSGPGIPPEALPHVFERFYRADRSRSRAEGGSGLGLAIAQQLAKAHGGEINALNLSGDGLQSGAEFVLTLPVKN